MLDVRCQSMTSLASSIQHLTSSFRRSYGNCTDRSAFEGVGRRRCEAAEHSAQRDSRHRSVRRGTFDGAVPRLVQPERSFVGLCGRERCAQLDGSPRRERRRGDVPVVRAGRRAPAAASCRRRLAAFSHASDSRAAHAHHRPRRANGRHRVAPRALRRRPAR